MGKEIIVFDIWSAFAHFRRGYTTTSSLTYPFPPKSAISGMIAGFLGIPNEQNKDSNYYKLFTPENFKVGIRILNPVNTIMIKENLIDTKVSFLPKQRTQIPIQFLKNPKFRIYVWFNEKLKNEKEKFIKFLQQHKSFYTPYLGVTECIANFSFVGIFKPEKIKENEEKECEIDSVIPRNAGEVKVEESKTYGTVKMPVFIDENRKGKIYAEFIYLKEGNPLNNRNVTSLRKNGNYFAFNVSGENVIFF